MQLLWMFLRRKTVCGAILVMLISANPALAAPGGVHNGLKIWLNANQGVPALDGEAVFVWQDQSGNGNDAIFNPFNLYAEQPPIYDATNPGVANNATLRFNNQHALELDMSFLSGSDYTVFVVNGRDRFGLANFYIAGESLSSNNNLVLGYEQIGLLRQAHFGNDLDAVVTPYIGTQLWAIDTFRFAQNSGRELSQNGVVLATDSNTIPLASNAGTTLGHFRAFGSFFWFQGDLAEVIVYDRALSPTERGRVETQLALHYGQPYDLDKDGVLDSDDNCIALANNDQTDINNDGYGDACVPPDTVIGEGVVIGRGPTIGPGSAIHKESTLGDLIQLGTGVLIVKGSVLGDYVSIGGQSRIGKETEVGNNSVIGSDVLIGKDCAIGSDVYIGDGTVIQKDVEIGDGAYIGNNVTILKGASVAAGAVVASGTIVGKDQNFP